MTDEKDKPDPEDENITFLDIVNYQSKKIGELLDFNQTIVKVCRDQAENWQNLARAYLKCADMANDIADSCAIAARISVDRAGDIIENEFGLVEVYDEDDAEEEEEEDGD